MEITYYSRELQDTDGFLDWIRIPTTETLNSAKTVIIVMDPWNEVSNLVPKIPTLNAFLSTARSVNITVCFSPYGSENIYKNHPCRLRVVEKIDPSLKLPYNRIDDVPRPVKVQSSQGKNEPLGLVLFGRTLNLFSSGVSDTSIHSSINVDTDNDIIAWTIPDIVSYFDNDLENIIFCGMHLNWCILNRPAGMEEWKRHGFNKLMVKSDCVVSTNEPRLPPYCSQSEIDALLLRYIESYWGYSF